MPKGNMYNWVTGTWNPIGGACPHDCSYCYVKTFRIPALKRKYSGPPKLITYELKKNLGKNKFWFVGSCFDIFASEILNDWIIRTLIECQHYDNKYLFQSKNPARISSYIDIFPLKSIIGTTIETNRRYPQMGDAPPPENRVSWMNYISKHLPYPEIMVTVEPIMAFDMIPLITAIKLCNPEWVNIGADSQGYNLPEPPADEIKELIYHLKKFTKVKVKKNLKRIIGD